MGKKQYAFYGWGQGELPRVTEAFGDLHMPEDLYEVLYDIWSAETCAPRLRARWTPENRTLGQCSITAFLAQDLFGGEVYGLPGSSGGVHCYNVVGERVFDLTSEQFGNEILDYSKGERQSRAVHFAKAEKKRRYELLKKKLLEKNT